MECFGHGLSATVERVSAWCISEPYPGAMFAKGDLGSREITVAFYVGHDERDGEDSGGGRSQGLNLKSRTFRQPKWFKHGFADQTRVSVFADDSVLTFL